MLKSFSVWEPDTRVLSLCENSRLLFWVCVSCSVLLNSLRPFGLYSLSGSSVQGIFQARILEWVAISFSRGSSLTQGLNLCLLHCRRILYPFSHQGSLSGCIRPITGKFNNGFGKQRQLIKICKKTSINTSGWWMVRDSNFLPGTVLIFLKVYFYGLETIIAYQLCCCLTVKSCPTLL